MWQQMALCSSVWQDIALCYQQSNPISFKNLHSVCKVYTKFYFLPYAKPIKIRIIKFVTQIN